MNAIQKCSLTCVIVGSFSMVAGAQVIEWEPVDASGDHTIIGNEIVLAGAGQNVTLHLKVSGWDPDSLGVTLGSYQAAIDPSHYLGANADPPNPGVDLNPYGWPIDPSQGIFQALKVCVETLQFPDIFDPLSICTTGTSVEDCGPFPAGCVDRPDFVFAGVDFVPTITTPTLAYAMGAATVNCATDPDGGITKFYGGTLILEVPADAMGTYTVGFNESPDYTLMTNCIGVFMDSMTRIPATITVACATNSDCSDNNACTNDVCEPDQTCSNTLNYNDATHCCDPSVGPPAGLTLIDDGEECTEDICDPLDGSVSHVPRTGEPCGGPPIGECDAQNTCDSTGACEDIYAPVHAPCGNPNPTDPDCDAPDACDGAGNCDANHTAEGVSCGSSDQTQCDNPDSCDGEGACDSNYEPPGVTCGDPSSSDCDNADSCDGSGLCDPNIRPDGFTCTDDGDECTWDECESGVCLHPPRAAGAPCGDDTNTDCDNPNTCDSDGFCLDNFEATGTTCGDPADTDCDNPDTCNGAGECQDNYEPSGLACGDNTDNECDNPDTCDGGGTCSDNYELEGVPCGSLGQTDCDNPDSCDGEGACDPNYATNGIPCDDGLFCTIDEYCTSGECGDGAFACNDDIGCTDGTCDEDTDTCDQIPNDGLCNNGQWCDGVEICDVDLDCVVQAGSVPDCDDQVECTDDSCNEVSDICVNTANDAHCNNGQWCDGVEICDPQQDCVVESGSVPNCDDGIDCTDDSCNDFNDICENDPNDSLCPQDGLFCNGSEMCIADTGCVSEGNPCGGDPGANCDEENDTCMCEGPDALAAGGRYIAVMLKPWNSAAPQAIVLEPSCPQGITRYAGPPQPFDLNYDGVTDDYFTELVNDPAEAAWLSPTEWGNFGLVYVTGMYVVPGTRYTVYADCGLPSAPSFSESTTVTTWRWGDVNNDIYVNVTDLQQLLFANERFDFSEHPMPHVDLIGSGDGVGACPPNQMINITDVAAHLWANEGTDYPDTFCPTECPPCIAQAHCNDFDLCTDDSCNLDATCSNVINFDEGIFCCNPNTGGVQLIDDGDLCTVDTCNPANGQVDRTPIDCQDTDDCTDDLCAEGACYNPPSADSTPCSGGVCCDGTCDAPVCSDNVDCDDSDSCTTDTCYNGDTCVAYCDSAWVACGPSDGCCPPNCTAEDDSDCECLPRGASCTENTECCSLRCLGNGKCK